MAFDGTWLGNFQGEWLGSQQQGPVNNISASIAGAGSLTASANASATLVAGLSGDSALVAHLTAAAGTPVDISASVSGSGDVNGQLTVHVPQSDGRSGISRQWLIDYYTKAFAKEEPAPPKVKKTPPKRRSSPVETPVSPVEKRIQEAVSKAEADIQRLTGSIDDAQAAQQFVAQLLVFAQESTKTIESFYSIGVNYRHSQQEVQHDLLLVAVGMEPPAPTRRLQGDEADLLLLMHVL